MNLQCRLRWLRAVVFASAALFLSPKSARNGRADLIGDLRIHSSSRYYKDREFVKQLNALERALDDIFKDSTKLTGLVIDVRINSGGSDCLDDEPVGRAGGANVARIQMLIKQLTGRLAINRMQPTQLISLSAP